MDYFSQEVWLIYDICSYWEYLIYFLSVINTWVSTKYWIKISFLVFSKTKVDFSYKSTHVYVSLSMDPLNLLQNLERMKIFKDHVESQSHKTANTHIWFSDLLSHTQVHIYMGEITAYTTSRKLLLPIPTLPQIPWQHLTHQGHVFNVTKYAFIFPFSLFLLERISHQQGDS